MLKSEFVIGATTAKHFYIQGRDFFLMKTAREELVEQGGGCYCHDVKIVICRFLESSFHSQLQWYS